MVKMESKTFVSKLIDIAKNYKTLYVMGCFGAPLQGASVDRYCNNHKYNKQPTRTSMIKSAANQNPPVYGFDCVCLIKGVLWGWSGNSRHVYGGARYNTNGVPDLDANCFFNKCIDRNNKNWSDMIPGEAVWCQGHIGVYIGDGLAVECTPNWANKVQITAVGNMGSKNGYKTRTWTKHGRLPWIDYSDAEAPKPEIDLNLSIGDIVIFSGTKHYASSSSDVGRTCKPGKAKITSIAKGSKHPYHLVKENDGTSTVYGWVDADLVEKYSIVKGSKVKVNEGAKTYTGGSLASYVYSTTYTVLEIKGSRVVIGINGAITAAMNIKDLTLL